MKRPNGELAPVSLLKMNSRVLAANGVVATVERWFAEQTLAATYSIGPTL